MVEDQKPPFVLSDRTYDILKWVVSLVLPAFGTLYMVLGGVWNLPFVDEIVQTVVGLTAFLGTVLGISVAQYNKAN